MSVGRQAHEQSTGLGDTHVVRLVRRSARYEVHAVKSVVVVAMSMAVSAVSLPLVSFVRVVAVVELARPSLTPPTRNGGPSPVQRT